ncbi:putative integral membrane protein [Vibrio sp. AND4]|nr:putative integral membrane protein [Vibrio sp. AND4]
MFISLAVTLAICAIFITLKAVRRISRLEEEVSLLHQELAQLHAHWFKRDADASQKRAPELHTSRPDPAPPESASQSYATALEPEKEMATLAAKKAPLSMVEANTPSNDDMHIARLAQGDNATFTKHANKLLTNVQENWLVWVGALAMLIGGGYLVQVIGSHIEFSPIMRVTIALTISLATTLAGEYFHRREQKNPQRAERAKGFTYVPAAITGTGLTGIYCTVIFAFVFYQLLSPSASLLVLAGGAFSSLALSLRQGPLMTVLGLIGGYSAPLWISGTEPNYYLLASYITSITLAALLLMQKSRHAWITPSTTTAHILWMLLMIESMPIEQIFSWLTIFLSLSLYLLFAVPRMGWGLMPRYRHCQGKWTHPPTGIALAIGLLVLSALARMPSFDQIEMLYLYAFFVAMIWLPAVRNAWSLRIYLPSILVPSIAIMLLSFALESTYVAEEKTLVLVVLGISIALIAMRTLYQLLSGDRATLTSTLFLVLAPTMTLITLLYISEFMPVHALGWTIFTMAVAIYYAMVGLRFRALAVECSAIMHAIIAGTALVWLNGTWLTTAISIQVAVMALQTQFNLFRPANWAVKVAMGILVVRLTLLPFIPEWQPANAGYWAWVLISYLPSLAILIYARTVLHRTNTELANWFEGAFLHIFSMAMFTQTNYWLTGQYGYLGYVDFTSAIVFASQVLVLGLVYSYRSQFAQQLTRVYQTYSYLLWAAFVVLMMLLNSLESPLMVNNVSADAMPVFNMLSLGWLLPAGILLVTTYQRWNTLRIPRQIVASFGLILAAIWLGMSIRQFWQPISMTLAQPTGMAELFTYSIAGLMVGGLLTWAGATRKAMTIQRIGLAVLACVALKVFLWDVRSLDGFWRAISFLGLGASLIGLGWLFQKLHRSVA